MQAVILAGGEGTRLRPLTHATPKPMVPVLNRPFLEYTLALLRRHGVTDVVLALHHLPHKIREHFGDGSSFGVRLSYSVEPTPLGTAGAVKHARHLLHGSCFVFNGDIYMDLDLSALAAAHRRSGAVATIALTTVKDPSHFGVVETDATGRVQRFLEKPAPGTTRARTINAGCYILELEALEGVPPGQHSMFERELFPALLQQGLPVYGYPTTTYWIDIGTPQNYLALHRALLLDLEPDPPPPGVQRGGRIWVGPGCRIDDTARLRGPLVLGARCFIGARAVVEGPAVLGAGCTVGPDAVVRGSVVWGHVQIGAGAHLQECLVGDHSSVAQGGNLAAGHVLGGNQVPNTGLRKARTKPPPLRP